LCQLASVPSQAEILLELTEKEIDNSGHKGHAAWIAMGLKIQEMQYGFSSSLSKIYGSNTKKINRLSLQALVRKLGSHPTPDQKTDITLRCSQLQVKVDGFQKQAGSILHTVSNDADNSWADDYTREIYTGTEFDGVGEEDGGLDTAAEDHNQMQFPRSSPPDGHINAEQILLHLLSHIGRSWCNRNGAKDLAKVELCLLEGQLNDSLHCIHIALGHKPYLFRNDMRTAHTQRVKTHAWGEVHAVKSTVQHHAWVYNRAWQSMVDLGARASLLNWYKVLQRQDLKIDTTVIAPHVHGQWNTSLPWFWSMDAWRDADVGAWMNDCMCFLFHTHPEGCSTNKFKCSLPGALAKGESSKDKVD